jgi:hypothetical protein
VAALGIWRRGGRDRDSGRDRNRRGDPQIARGRRGGRLRKKKIEKKKRLKGDN